MLFNSASFLIFFPIVVAAYFVCPFRWRWALLIGASYFFYMQWEPRYAALILASTVTDFVASAMMRGKATRRERRPWLYLSLAVNLGMLFLFKYYDWFNASLSELTGMEPPLSHLLLPVGISFFTLQSMGYTIDVYRGTIEPEEKLRNYALYAVYFPQLVAGPIGRAKSLLPQLEANVRFDPMNAADGLARMTWGMFKKVCIADRLAPYTMRVFEGDPEAFSGPSLALATVLFCFQVYSDFSGYSDLAIGAAQVMGVRLTENFRRPFFARDIRELWARWHMSLVGWLNDYLYQPLAYAARRSTQLRRHLNIIFVFLITGLWHGASWKFVAWGLVNGLFVVGHAISLPLRRSAVAVLKLERVPQLHATLSIAFTFALFCLGGVFFAARNLDDALGILARMPFGWSGWSSLDLSALLLFDGPTSLLLVSCAVGALVAAEVVEERKGSLPNQRMICFALALWIMLFGVFERDEFVYFQF